MKASRSRRSRERLRREIEELKETRDRVRQEAQKTHFEIGVAMASAGSRSIEEFLSAARRSEQVRSRVLALETTSRDLGGQRDRIASERQRLCEKLKESLESAGLAWSPETLDAQVAGLRENLRHFKTLDQEYQNCLQTEGSLLEDEIPASPDLTMTSAKNILLVEADHMIEGWLCQILRAEAFNVSVARSLPEASMAHDTARKRSLAPAGV